MSNPFAPSTLPLTQSRRPGLRATLRFLLGRLVVLLLLPTMAASGLLSAWPWRPWVAGVAVIICFASFVPTSALLFWTRYLAGDPASEARPVLLGRNEWMTQDAAVLWLRTRAVEWTVVGILGALLSVSILLGAGQPRLLVLDLFLFTISMAVLYLAAILHIGVAVFRANLIAVDAEGRARAVVLLRRTRSQARLLGRRAVDGVRVHLAVALLHDGQIQASLEAIEGIRYRRARRHADFFRAQVLCGRGDTSLARTLLAHERGGSLLQDLGAAYTEALADLHDGHPDAIVARAEAWETMMDGLTPAFRSTFLLLRCAAHEDLGQHTMADEAYQKAAVVPDERPWIRATWPRWWKLIRAVQRRQHGPTRAESR